MSISCLFESGRSDSASNMEWETDNIRAQKISVNPIPPRRRFYGLQNLDTLIIFGRIFFLIQERRFENHRFQGGAVSIDGEHPSPCRLQPFHHYRRDPL